MIIAIWIKIDSSGPIFFRQERIGLFGKPFLIHKFRTMSVIQNNSIKITVGNDVRITKSGFFLRKYKLDELPQLIDVFIGKMSLVGPRPEVEDFVKYYPSHLKDIIFSVRPGITDLASIQLVNESEVLAKFDDPVDAYINHILPVKLEFYKDYALKNSIFGDIKIIFLTIASILR